ncbi:Lreu_0056 family protein [Lactobacillus terrae]|uniref:Lreu_0056 family protein n=1 Tax=Lactobacillus terrae TaxID=2269374 RepID=UPI000C1B6B1D|nr:DUF4767 domain-containing protein [Lactobacillus terrae]
MKNKRFYLVLVSFLAIVLITGCGNNSQKSSKAEPSKTETTKKVTKPKKVTTPWDNQKDQKLESFINGWAPKMNQSYTRYDGKNPLKTSVGDQYPDDFNRISINGNKYSIGWSPKGNGNYEYNVVAIYNHDGTEPPAPNRITYLFTFHNGKPVVLVSESRDGDPRFFETQNNEIKNSFAQIADGKNSDQSANTTQSNSTTDNSGIETRDLKEIGVMVRQLLMPGDDLAKETLLGISYYNGKYFIGTGTSVSTVGYVVNGDTVLCYKKDASTGKPTFQQEYVESSISLKELESRFYSTPAQKQLVQSVANRMPDIESE